MPQVEVSQDILQQIQKALPVNASIEQFVADAVREKLADPQRQDQSARLAEIVQQAKAERKIQIEDALREWNELCKSSPICGAPRLTRDELHRRDI